MSEPEITRHTLEVPRTARFHCSGELGAASPEVGFALHGYGQLAAPFLGSLAALARPGRLLVAPEALSRFYQRRGAGEVGASWMTREERALEIVDTVRYLDLVWERVRSLHALGREARPFALGFSQGGAAAARWAVLGHAPLVAVTLWGCPVPADLELERHRERARALRWTLVLGEADTSIDRAAWEQGVERLRAAGIEPELVRFAGAHELEAATLGRLFA